MAGFNIRDFTSHINSNGMMRNNKFLVRMPYPAGFDGSSEPINTSRYLELWCESATLPGITMSASGNKRYGYGPTEKYVTSPEFNGCSMIFMGDSKGAILQYLQKWMMLSCNFDARYGQGWGTGYDTRTNTLTGTNPPTYQIAYKNDYVVDVNIKIFNETGANPINMYLREAFPINIGDINLNWGDTNDYMKIPVEFAFTDWYVAENDESIHVAILPRN